MKSNKEKAREIGNLCEECFGERKKLTCQFDCTNKGKYYGALEMAEWKDKQFKEYLEKKYDTALNAWDDWAAYDPKTAESWRVKTQYIREIINELFKED